MNKIRKGDEVIVITGRDKGKRGKITRVLENGRVVVAGVFEQVADLLAAADLFVLPAMESGSTLALLEAMAAGLPSVAGDVAGPAKDQSKRDSLSALVSPPRESPGSSLEVGWC